MATVSTPNSVLKEGYEGITTQPFRAESCFQRSAPGVAMVAMVATSQMSHKVRVERSGATLGRRRVVNPTSDHGEDHTPSHA